MKLPADQKRKIKEWIDKSTKLYDDGRYFVVKLDSNIFPNYMRGKYYIARRMGKDKFRKVGEADIEKQAKEVLKTVRNLNGDNILVVQKKNGFHFFDVKTGFSFGHKKTVKDAEKYIAQIYGKFYQSRDDRANLEKIVKQSKEKTQVISKRNAQVIQTNVNRFNPPKRYMRW